MNMVLPRMPYGHKDPASDLDMIAHHDDFQLFTSLRYDTILLESEENSRSDLNFVTPSPFYMLTYHRDRMLEAAQHFGFAKVEERLADGTALHNSLLAGAEGFISPHGEPLEGHVACKIKISFNKQGCMSTAMDFIPAVPLSTLYPSSFSPPKSSHPSHPAKKQQEPTFTPSPLTGGALTLGPTDQIIASQASTPSPRPAPQWTLRLDTAATPSSPFTLLKTSARDMYDASRARALPEDPEGSVYREVMLWNEVNELTEGSLTSLYLFRGGRWVTPPVGLPSFFSSEVQKSDDAEGEGELRTPFAGRWGHSIRSAHVGAGGQRGTSRRWALGKGFCMEEPVSVDTVNVGEQVWVSNGVRGFGLGTVVEK